MSETVKVKNTHLPECADCVRSYEKWCSFLEARMTCDYKQYLQQRREPFVDKPAAVSAEPERLIRAFCEGARFAWGYFPGELGSEYDAEEVEREARTLARSNELAITPAPANVCPLPQVKCSGEEAPVGTFTCPPSCRAKEVEK
jgi:hypothetical protein